MAQSSDLVSWIDADTIREIAAAPDGSAVAYRRTLGTILGFRKTSGSEYWVYYGDPDDANTSRTAKVYYFRNGYQVMTSLDRSGRVTSVLDSGRRKLTLDYSKRGKIGYELVVYDGLVEKSTRGSTVAPAAVAALGAADDAAPAAVSDAAQAAGGPAKRFVRLGLEVQACSSFPRAANAARITAEDDRGHKVDFLLAPKSRAGDTIFYESEAFKQSGVERVTSEAIEGIRKDSCPTAGLVLGAACAAMLDDWHPSCESLRAAATSQCNRHAGSVAAEINGAEKEMPDGFTYTATVVHATPTGGVRTITQNARGFFDGRTYTPLIKLPCSLVAQGDIRGEVLTRRYRNGLKKPYCTGLTKWTGRIRSDLPENGSPKIRFTVTEDTVYGVCDALTVNDFYDTASLSGDPDGAHDLTFDHTYNCGPGKRGKGVWRLNARTTRPDKRGVRYYRGDFVRTVDCTKMEVYLGTRLPVRTLRTLKFSGDLMRIIEAK